MVAGSCEEYFLDTMDELQAEYKALNTEKGEIELKLNDLNEVLNDVSTKRLLLTTTNTTRH